MKILITGVTGFVGSHLAEYCLTKPNVQVYGIVRPADLKSEIKNIESIKKNITLIPCELTNEKKVLEAIKKVKPDKIFHLAAENFVPLSWKFPKENLANNIFSELNIFEAIKKLNLNPVMVIACAGGEYGLVHKKELPLRETNLLRPLTPYALSKVAQEMLAFQYYRSGGFKTVLARFFAIEGPRRRSEFGVSSFAKQIAQIEKGKSRSLNDRGSSIESGQKPIIYVGNLNAQNDFLDVQDAVRAYWLASEKCKFGEPYNVCSEKAKSMKWVLDTLVALSTVKNIIITVDPKRVRPIDVPVVVGDCSKFKKQTGWKPKIPLEKTLEGVLNYWRALV